MRSIALLFLLSTSAVCAAETLTSEDWSKPVDGLRGRLSIGEEGTFNDTRIAVVYLDLQNVTGALGSLLVDIDQKVLKFEVVDRAGNFVARPELADASVFEPLPYTLSLPFDSTLRFRVSVSGYGIPKNAGLAIQLSSGLILLPTNKTRELYLVGTFNVPDLSATDVETRRNDRRRGEVWRGTLNLPKVKIPLDPADTLRKQNTTK